MTAAAADDLARKLKLAGVPERLWVARLDAVPDTFEYKRQVVKWLKLLLSGEAKYGLYLVGHFGTGKTSLAAAILRIALANRVHGQFVRYTDLAEYKRYNPQWHNDVDTGIWDWARKAPLLVIDDAFKVSSDYEEKFNIAAFSALFEDRVDNNRLTILTGNIDLEGLEKKRGLYARMAHLILQSCYIVQVDGVDYRTYIAQNRKVL